MKLDASQAEKLPGVSVVLTKENTKGWGTSWHTIPEIAFPEVFTHEGGEVAAVATDDITTAQKPLALIEVEYEVPTPMLDAEETLKNPPPSFNPTSAVSMILKEFFRVGGALTHLPQFKKENISIFTAVPTLVK